MQISLFQRYKAFVNSHDIGETYTTDQLFENVGRYEASTWWKRMTKQRMYRTCTYQTYLHRLGAVQNVKRGVWKVLHHVPEWFYSKHANYLLGYGDRSRAESMAVLEAIGCPEEAMQSIYIPESQRKNPFKLTSIETMSTPSKAMMSILSSESHKNELSKNEKKNADQIKIDIALLRSLYDSANDELKSKLEQDYPEHFTKYFNFGEYYELDTTSFNEGPLLIGEGLVPDRLRHKALLINNAYEAVIENLSSYTDTTKILYFVKKQKQ